MKASEAKLLDFLRQSPQFVIPIYQRTYSWTDKECRQLWTDIIRAGENDKVTAHFVGSIVYIESGLSQVSSQSPILVIDGQQRLTTLTILLAALARHLDQLEESKREPLDGFSPRKIRNYYLVNPEEDGERHYKLILSQTDKASLLAIVGDNEQPSESSIRITENSKLFDSLISSPKTDLSSLCKGLAKLIVVDVALNRDQDNPQLIFESMNSTGRELSQADLIRNFVLMGLDPKVQTMLYEKYWRPMEAGFGQDAYAVHFDAFMRHYLTVKTGTLPNQREVYDAFKTYARSPETLSSGVEALVSDVREYSRYFCAMALGAEPNVDLNTAFHDLRELKVDVAYPFLLELYHDYAHDLLSAEDFLTVVRLIEAYVFRRAICNVPTNSRITTFATFTKALRKDRYLESVQAHFLSMASYRRFPGDEEFQRDLKSRDLYGFPRRNYWLRRLENHGRKELVPVHEYSIEHILPQNEKLSAAWREALGPEWERIRQTWLHTLGNLTLTKYNSEYGDRPFTEKRDMEGGFKLSPLKLNQGLGQLETWNEETIKARADKLSALAVSVWALPKLSADVLAEYKKPAPATGYTLDDHPYLGLGAMRNLFEAFRKEVLALDPCVTEDFLKLYVAYKAETNFVDIIPQAKRMVLVLNMAFADVSDPKALCKDVTGLGRWGNGDVQLAISQLDELPYAMSIVRQSFEKQMGAGVEA